MATSVAALLALAGVLLIYWAAKGLGLFIASDGGSQ